MVLEKTTTLNQSLNTQKGYMVSITLHAALFAALAFFTVDEIKPIEVPMSIELDLSAVSTEESFSKSTVTPSSATMQFTPTVQQSLPISRTEPKISNPIASVAPSAVEPVSEPVMLKEQHKSLSAEPVAVITPKSVEAIKPIATLKSDVELEKEFVKTNFGMIRDSILAKLVYPNIARRMGHTGIVEVAMVIGINGKLKNHFVSKSSGFPLLDEAALKAVAAIGSESLPKPQVESQVVLPISFKLKA